MKHISMTVPESLRGEVMVDGARVHLTPLEMRMVSALLVTPPDRVIETYDLIEIMWPNPDTQPETATKIITVVKYKLLTKGIEIKNCWGRGLYAFRCREAWRPPGAPARTDVHRGRSWLQLGGLGDPMKISGLVTRFNGFSLWPKIIIGIAAALLVTGLAVRASGALHYIIFGNTEAKRERGNTVVAQEQTKAEANIADGTIQTVHERDVYREHIT
jgi:hypothetical protein